MSRLLLIAIFIIWMMPVSANDSGSWGWLSVFLLGYLIPILILVWLSSRLASRLRGGVKTRDLEKFNRIFLVGRVWIPAWLAAGIFMPSRWENTVYNWLGPVINLHILTPVADRTIRLELPTLVLGTLPALLAWMGTSWAQYPADRALREQSLLDQLDNNLPVHEPPSLYGFLLFQFRFQILFFALPIMGIYFIRDAGLVIARIAGWSVRQIDLYEGLSLILGAIVIFILAPEGFRWILGARRMADSELRGRLEGICGRLNLRYRDILLWNTHYTMGNAAVMGILPRWRYVLMSDLLLETLSDRQIEAVFAHELGHIVHRHMLGYVAFFTSIAMFSTPLVVWLNDWLPDSWFTRHLGEEGVQIVCSALSSFGVIFLCFGYLSRMFERQADVFAARTMTRNDAAGVEMDGAETLASALERVAWINNIPLRAWSWCHGSLAGRQEFVRKLRGEPGESEKFDRTMRIIHWLLRIAPVVGAGLTWWVVWSKG